MKNKTNADKLLTTKQARRAERDAAIESLKESLKPGDTVYTILRSVSTSGMSRCLDVYAIKGERPLRLTWSAATALEATYDRKKSALRVNGVGMDMGYSMVHNLAQILFGDGYALQHRWL